MLSSLQNLFKKYIQDIHPYEPGKPIKEVERELGLRHIVKLASNENPLGASGRALRAMRRAIRDVHLYPEGSCHYLIERLVKDLEVDKKNLIVGNGSNEIIELLVRGFINEGDQVLTSEKTFLVYPILTQACGGELVTVPMKDYRYDLEALANAITDKTKLIFIASPNNPTGTYLTSEEVEVFLDRVPSNVLVCFDEAYVDFVDAPDFPHMLRYILEGRSNVVALRTFSKSHGLAGLRIGYGVGDPEVIGYLHKIRQPFNVNAIAQAAATAALEDKFFLWRTKQMVIKGRQFFYKQFKQMGLRYLPSQANFVLFDTGRDGEQVMQELLKKGVIVRSMKAYDLPSWIRVTVGRRNQNALFIRCLKDVLK